MLYNEQAIRVREKEDLLVEENDVSLWDEPREFEKKKFLMEIGNGKLDSSKFKKFPENENEVLLLKSNQGSSK